MSKFEIALRLREIREKKGYMQADVATFLNTTVQKVSSFETGRTRVDLETLVELSKFYNVDVNYILGSVPPAGIPALCIQEQHVLELYRHLNTEGQNKVDEYVADLVASGRYTIHCEVGDPIADLVDKPDRLTKSSRSLLKGAAYEID